MNNFKQCGIADDRSNGIEHILPSVCATMPSAWVAVFIISIITCIFQIELLYIITYLLSAQTSLWLHDERKPLNAFDRTESSALTATVHIHFSWATYFVFHFNSMTARNRRTNAAFPIILFRLSTISGEMPENSYSWLSAPNFRWHENQLGPLSFVIRIN